MRHTRILDSEVDIGPGTLEMLPDVVARVRQSGTAIVIVGTTARAAMWSDAVARLVVRIDARVVEVPSGLVTAETVDSLHRSTPLVPGVVVAIGGGRIIDAAKLLVAKWTAGVIAIPIVAVPTTAGSGSELTPFATRWNPELGRKESVSDEKLTPRAVIIDPLLSATCSPAVGAAAAFDALSQAIESGWSTKSTSQSFDLSMQALSLICQGFLDPGGPASHRALTSLSEGALLAGAAISIANTTAPHGVSYPLTLEFGLLHGHAVALTLGRFIRFNAESTQADCEDSRGISQVHDAIHHIFGCMNVRSASHAESWVDEAVARFGLAPLAAFSLDAEALAVDALSYDRTANNPRRLDVEILARLLCRDV